MGVITNRHVGDVGSEQLSGAPTDGGEQIVGVPSAGEVGGGLVDEGQASSVTTLRDARSMKHERVLGETLGFLGVPQIICHPPQMIAQLPFRGLAGEKGQQVAG